MRTQDGRGVTCDGVTTVTPTTARSTCSGPLPPLEESPPIVLGWLAGLAAGSWRSVIGRMPPTSLGGSRSCPEAVVCQ
eukprot:4758092-Pyramimonas_sp.AAC.1